MKTIYLTIAFCLILSVTNSQNRNAEIVQQYIENFNTKDSIATLDFLKKDFIEYWQSSVINKNKREYSKYFSWSSVMKEYEIIEIVSDKGNKVIVNSTYYSDLDKILNKLPYKCKKTFILSKGKISKIISSKNKGYDLYQNKRKKAFLPFKNWLFVNYGLRRQDFKINRKGAKQMKKIVIEYVSKDKIVDR